GGGREFGFGPGWNFGRLARHADVPSGDSSWGGGVGESADGGEGASAAAGRGTQADCGKRCRTGRGSGGLGGTGDARRSGVSVALDLQERATAGGGIEAAGARHQ